MFLIKVLDADSALKKPPTVRLKDSSGATAQATGNDQGKETDDKANDHLYSAPITFKVKKGATLGIQVRSGSLSWETSAKVDLTREEAELIITLRRGGKIEVASSVAKPPPDTPPGKGEPRAQGDKRPGTAGSGPRTGQGLRGTPIATAPTTWSGATTTRGKQRSRAIWMIVGAWGFTALGFGLALLLGFGRRKAARAAKLKVDPAPAPVPPVRLARGDLPGALDGPLAGLRLVVVGPPLEGVERPITCPGPAPFVESLVRAVEELAVTEGPGVALLVSEAEDHLDVGGKAPAAQQLADRVDARFPLWVVDGPEQWAAWPGADEAPPEADGDDGV